MIRRYMLPLLALAGFASAVHTVVAGRKPMPVGQPVSLPARPPYESYIAGAGIIEASSENIAVSTPVAGLVTEVYVKPGSRVRQGEPLFRLDDRDMRAELLVRKATLEQAQARLRKLVSQPRAEDLPPVEARVKEAEATLADLQHQLQLWEGISDKRAVSQDELSRKQFAVRVAQAKLGEAQSELAALKAGAWKPDVDIAQAEVAAAEAQLQSVETEIDRRIIRAPIDGEVLQVKIRVGESAQLGIAATPLMLIGAVQPLHVRVDVDENDAWRLSPEAPAMAFLRGNREISTPAAFVRAEPYVVPKRSLTGDSMERVDTRVLQVIYQFDRRSLPLYVGQQMDVFIEAPPIGSASTRPSEIRP